MQSAHVIKMPVSVNDSLKLFEIKSIRYKIPEQAVACINNNRSVLIADQDVLGYSRNCIQNIST